MTLGVSVIQLFCLPLFLFQNKLVCLPLRVCPNNVPLRGQTHVLTCKCKTRLKTLAREMTLGVSVVKLLFVPIPLSK